jgi:hypothetical protein
MLTKLINTYIILSLINNKYSINYYLGLLVHIIINIVKKALISNQGKREPGIHQQFKLNL